MAKIYKSVIDAIGNTPLIELSNLKKELGFSSDILVKAEYFNPGGSVKDRVAKAMIEDAEKSGVLKPGATIIEPTSGNTGIGLGCVCAIKGYRLIIVMPETMSVERQKIMSAYGAELVLTDGAKGMQGSIDKANELQKQIPNSFVAGQFVNPSNPKAHYETTAVEIWRDSGENIDYFVAGVGTGGTISGIGKYLKEQNSNIQVIAVEPKGSPVLSENRSGKHNIQGIGAGFVPDNLDASVYDEVITVSDEKAINMSKYACKKEGLFVGISSGAAIVGGVEIAKRHKDNKKIVVLLPDSADRYYSTGLF